MIELAGYYNYQGCPYPVRRIEAFGQTGEIVVLLTNHPRFGASAVSAVYKDQWQIEILFRNLKQYLRIKTLIGTPPNEIVS